MTRKLIKNSFNELFEQKQLPSPSSRERMLQFQIKSRKKQFRFIPAIVTIMFFIGICASIVYMSQSDIINTDTESTYFNNTFSIKDGKYYLYDLTLGEPKTKVIERLGNEYVEDTNLELGGSRYYSRLAYENLNLTFLFREDKVVSIMMEIKDTEEFERLYQSYYGDKFFFEASTEPTNESNAKHLYSEETLQIVTAKYDPYQTLWLTISATSPEFISNLKKGIYE